MPLGLYRLHGRRRRHGRLCANVDAYQDYMRNKLNEMDELASMVRSVTAEAYALADKRGRLPDRIEVEASFDMDSSGRLALNQSRRFPGAVKVKMGLAAQAAPPGLRLIADYAAKESVRDQKKSTRKRVNHSILYRRQGGYCAGCRHYFQPRNLTIDHVVPKFSGGSDDIPNLQLALRRLQPVEGERNAGAIVGRIAGPWLHQSGAE